MNTIKKILVVFITIIMVIVSLFLILALPILFLGEIENKWVALSLIVLSAGIFGGLAVSIIVSTSELLKGKKSPSAEFIKGYIKSFFIILVGGIIVVSLHFLLLHFGYF